MKVLLFLIVCLSIPEPSTSEDFFQKILGFGDKIFGGIGKLFKDDNCGCPCREYYVPKCVTEYREQCYQEHYETKCIQTPVQVPQMAKEIECQKCRKFQVTVYKPKLFKECNPVFDEKCSTKYQKHCKTNQKCVHIYKTMCTQYGYEQHCEQVPSESCYPETVCHKTPQTSCYPIKTEKCKKVKKDVPVPQEKHECLAFENIQMHNPEPAHSCPNSVTVYGGQEQAHGGQEQAYGGQGQAYGGQEQGYGGQEQGYGGQGQVYNGQEQIYGGQDQGFSGQSQQYGGQGQVYGGQGQQYGGQEQAYGRQGQTFSGQQQGYSSSSEPNYGSSASAGFDGGYTMDPSFGVGSRNQRQARQNGMVKFQS